MIAAMIVAMIAGAATARLAATTEERVPAEAGSRTQRATGALRGVHPSLAPLRLLQRLLRRAQGVRSHAVPVALVGECSVPVV